MELYIYILEMNDSRDIKSEFKDEIETFIPRVT